jgi:hypothetical protein
MQARLIAAAPRLLKLAKDLRDYVRESIEDMDEELIALAKRADQIRNQVESEIDISVRPKQEA